MTRTDMGIFSYALTALVLAFSRSTSEDRREPLLANPTRTLEPQGAMLRASSNHGLFIND